MVVPEHWLNYRVRVLFSIVNRAGETTASWSGQSAGKLKTKQGDGGALHWRYKSWLQRTWTMAHQEDTEAWLRASEGNPLDTSAAEKQLALSSMTQEAPDSL